MPSDRSRQYSDLTIKRLYALSGNRCAFPGCDVTFVNAENEKNRAEICHILDANPNKHKADRYDPHVTPDQRREYSNLILLCRNHHNETNDPILYPADVLRKMKREHEAKVELAGRSAGSIQRNPTIFAPLIKAIASSMVMTNWDEEIVDAPDADEKILYNDLIDNRDVVEEYSRYQGKLSMVYQAFEMEGQGKKSVLLRAIREMYLKEKRKFRDIDQIRANADRIFDSVRDQIWEVLEQSSTTFDNLETEAIDQGIQVILVDAFLACKILEEPPRK